MKMFATIILLSLCFTSIVHVVEGKRKCFPCKDIGMLRAQLGKLNTKIDQVNTTLHKELASGGSSGSGGGGGAGGAGGGSGGGGGGGGGGSGSSITATSCKDIHDKANAQDDKAYDLTMPNIGKIPVYCHMSNSGLGECGGGGWTLVMKIDGTKKTFHYDSNYWIDKTGFGSSLAGQALDTNEVKLPTYWNTPFTKVCLGMKTNGQLNFMLVPITAASLYSVIADGQHRSTFLGRNKWKTLIGSAASLQPNCNMEGFNNIGKETFRSRARIGILGNEQNDCVSPDSRIGFGTGGLYDDSNTCGNEATCSPDNGNQHIKTMGYILVQ